ncbi:MAG: hypothetical protein KY445_04895 [Armatimonadetes bacterium]|nr:hypothetical protein [Armatimonadota bacterium]
MQTFADAQIRLHPPSAIPKKATDSLIVADLLGTFASPGFGDSNGILPQSFYDLNQSIPTAYAGNAYGVRVRGLEFITFLADGTAKRGTHAINPADASSVNAMRGWYISPRDAALDSKIGDNAGDFDGDNTDLNWDAQSGTWETAPVLNKGGGTAICNRGGHEIAVARSAGAIPANRAHRVDLHLQGAIKRGGRHSIARHFFGNSYCIAYQHGQKPQIQRVTYNADGAGGVLQTLKTLSEHPTVNAGGGKYRFLVMRLGGRLVVVAGGVTVWLYDAQSTTENGRQTNTVKDVEWPEANWQLEAVNVRLRAEYGVVKFSQADGDALTGTLERTIRKSVPVDPSVGAVAEAGGWKYGGTRAEVAPTLGEQSVTYTLTLAGGPDGIDSPLIDKVLVSYAPTWTNPAQPFIDVRSCCESLSLSFVAPPDGAGAQGTVVLDRNRLDQQFPNWQNFAQMWNPVTINVKRAGTDYAKMFQGYIFKPSRTSGLGSERKLTLVLRDPTVRLQKIGECHNAAIDHRYPPLDLLFAQRQGNNGGYDQNGNVQSGSLYIAECVKEILRIALGDAQANRINGNGNPMRFIPANHPPLITTRNDTAGWSTVEAIGAAAPVASGNWLAPPPFGSAAYDWIMDLARRDRCVFYYGWPDGTNSDWPVPIYGRLQNILGARTVPLHRLPDVAINGDWTRLLQGMEIEKRPERDINTVDVWGAEAQGLEGLVPSLRIASVPLPASDPRHARNSWERKLIIREPLALLGAEAIAQGVIGLLAGVTMQWPSFTFEGDERVGLGHLVAASLTGENADRSSAIGRQRFRVERADHNISFSRDSGDYKMTVQPRPLTSGEENAFDGVTAGDGAFTGGGSI